MTAINTFIWNNIYPISHGIILIPFIIVSLLAMCFLVILFTRYLQNRINERLHLTISNAFAISTYAVIILAILKATPILINLMFVRYSSILGMAAIIPVFCVCSLLVWIIFKNMDMSNIGFKRPLYIIKMTALMYATYLMINFSSTVLTYEIVLKVFDKWFMGTHRIPEEIYEKYGGDRPGWIVSDGKINICKEVEKD